MALGVVALLQVLFVPGFLALVALRIRTQSLIEAGVISAALSLVMNYLLVYLLASIGVLGRPAVMVVLLCELLFGAYLFARHRAMREAVELKFPVRRLATSGTSAKVIVPVARTAALVASLISVAVALRFNVFTAWDALFSWNRWAYVWYTGQIPHDVMLYPQLIPANWALIYLIVGSPEAQLFPLAMMPLFGIGLLAMFWDLGLRRQRLEYLIALPLLLLSALVLFFRIAEQFGGFVDLAVTFMAMASLYLLELREDRCPRNWRELSLPLLLAAGASVTKLNAAFVLAAVVALALVGHFRSKPTLTKRDWADSIGGSLAIAVLLPGLWYGMKFLDFSAGKDATNAAGTVAVATAAAGGNSLLARLLHAVTQLPLGWFGVLLLFAVLLLVPRLPRARWVALGILLPYTALWALLLSYDVRNWIVMVPLAVYAASMVIGDLLESRGLDMNAKVKTQTARWAPATMGAVMGVCVLTVAVFSAVYTPAKIVAREVQEQRRIGEPGLNIALYGALAGDAPLRGSFLTEYWQLSVLPGFRGEPFRVAHTRGNRFRLTHHSEVNVSELDDYDYLLLSDSVSPTVSAVLEDRLKQGDLSTVMEYRSPGFGWYSGPVTLRLFRVHRQAR